MTTREELVRAVEVAEVKVDNLSDLHCDAIDRLDFASADLFDDAAEAALKELEKAQLALIKFDRSELLHTIACAKHAVEGAKLYYDDLCIIVDKAKNSYNEERLINADNELSDAIDALHAAKAALIEFDLENEGVVNHEI